MNRAARSDWRPRSSGLAAALVAALWLAPTAAAAPPNFGGGKTAWHGFDRHDFLMDEADFSIKPHKAPPDEGNAVRTQVKGQLRCVVVAPKQAAPGNPWSWRGYYFDHEPQAEIELLKRGFHVGFVWCDAGKPWDAWYRFLTETHGLSKKPAFVGMSRGGRNAYTWATTNPDKVSCIYADNPAVSREAVAMLGALAKSDVPVLHVCGSRDPWLDSQTRALERRYKELGGQVTVIVEDGKGHFPTAPKDVKPVVEFILGRQAPNGPEPGREPAAGAAAQPRDYRFDKTMSREVLENYLSRSISMEGLLNGRGDLDDNVRMLKATGAKFIGRSLCLWGGEANLLRNLERAKEQVPKIHAADPDMILQACVFESVSTQVGQVPVPDWAFAALGRPAEKRNFRYADMLYPDGRRQNQWGRNSSVPDVSRTETKLWFYFLAASFIDLGFEAIHFGQAEIMNGNDCDLEHWSQVLDLVRAYAARHARRHMVLCDAHVPSGGLVRDGRLLFDFHSFPLRIVEVPDKPQEAILKVGFSDGIYGRSKGGVTPSGWKCDHLPYLVEIDNWGVSRQPGQPGAGGIWVWGYDEITWFAHRSREYRAAWLRYAWDWVRKTDPDGYLQMPGSRTVRSPRDGMRWYHANAPSPAVPTGLGDEEAIRAIWAADPARR